MNDAMTALNKALQAKDLPVVMARVNQSSELQMKVLSELQSSIPAEIYAKLDMHIKSGKQLSEDIKVALGKVVAPAAAPAAAPVASSTATSTTMASSTTVVPPPTTVAPLPTIVPTSTPPPAPVVPTISFDEDTIPIKTGETHPLSAKVNPSSATVSWASDKPDIVSVDTEGKATANKAGSAIITATVGTVSASITVNVKVPTSTSPPAPSFDSTPNPNPPGVVNAGNKDVVKAAFNAHQFYQNTDNKTLHIISKKGTTITYEMFNKNVLINSFGVSKIQTTPDTMVDKLIDGNFSSVKYSDITNKSLTFMQSGGTRKRKMNRRRKTGKRAKPSLVSPLKKLSSQQLF